MAVLSVYCSSFLLETLQRHGGCLLSSSASGSSRGLGLAVCIFRLCVWAEILLGVVAPQAVIIVLLYHHPQLYRVILVCTLALNKWHDIIRAGALPGSFRLGEWAIDAHPKVVL